MGTIRGQLDEDEAWIICRGRVVAVSGGLVVCDAETLVRVEQCLGCRHLETLAGERDREPSCATPDPVTPRPVTLHR